jgi:hypothetical protein
MPRFALSSFVIFAGLLNAQTPAILQDYIYGYAPVAMEATRAIETAVPDTTSPGRAPINQFAYVDQLATPAERLIIRPNADTLYTSAWLDVTSEPLILHVPDTEGRYYVIPMLDAYSNEFASIGSRTTGNNEGNYAIVGPFWHGALPKELTGVMHAPTDTIWLLGRTLVHGESDVSNAVAVTHQYQLIPLSAYADFLATGNYTPPTGMPFKPVNPDFIGGPVTNSPVFSKPEFFDVLFGIALRNPVQASGLVVDGVIHQRQLTSDVVSAANAALAEKSAGSGIQQNGWTINLDRGSYGTDYLARAAATRFGFGTIIAADAIYPSTRMDTSGNALDGTKSYAIHFAPGQTPPAHGFWSLTVYDQNGFLVANSINRYTVGSETGLVSNGDGSIDILLQSTAPGMLGSNWLPVPAGPFNLTLRLYWPDESALNGAWVVPPVEAALR